MEKFALLIFCITFYSIRATDCDPDLVPCQDVHDIATITCGGGIACTILCGAGLEECPPEIVVILGEVGNEIKTIDAGICKQKCREQSKLPEADPVCEFYRWEEKGEGSKCILQTVCEPDMWCQPDEPDNRCMTGQIGCTEDGTHTCSLDSPVKYHHDLFHLICHGVSGDINIYSETAIAGIPTGTVCYTIHMCDKWEDVSDVATYYRKLAVFCDGELGTWKSMEESDQPVENQTGDDAKSKLMIVDNTLEEPKCESECIDLITLPANLEPAGTELICDTPLIGNNLKDGNSCILICDNHFAMSISCEFKYDGTKDWMDENRDMVNQDKVIC